MSQDLSKTHQIIVVDRSGRVAGRDTDRYADRLYDEAANAMLELEEHFRPFLDALKPTIPGA